NRPTGCRNLSREGCAMKGKAKATQETKKRQAIEAKAASDVVVTSAEPDPGQDRLAVMALIAKHGSPSEPESEAFGSLLDDHQRAELGGKTRAIGVLHDGVEMAAAVDKALDRVTATV